MAQTQNTETECVSQTQPTQWSNFSSQVVEPVAWGRLYGKRILMKTMDLCQETFSVGRDRQSNICITKETIAEKSLAKISKTHFIISREQCDISKPVYIKDNSLNGTFVNGELIGQNKKRILQSDDTISMAYPNWKVFVFKDFGISNAENIPLDIRNKYFISSKLGAGAGGFVRLVYNRRTCEEFAMKQVKKNALVEFNDGKHDKNPDRVMNEAKIMQELQHPCVIRMHEIVEKPDSVFMILEYMKGGDLLTRIVSQKRLSEQTSKLFFYQMCHAVKYLHDKGITHRDLKPDNVLLASRDEETLVKVSDFGLSKLVSNDSVMKTVCGTPLYVAPEVLMTGGRGTYTKKVDIWSLGVVLFTCLSGTLPFSDEYGRPASDQIKEGRFKFTHSSWKNISPNAKSLITKMLTVDCNQRPSIDYILQNEWLQDAKLIEKANELMKTSSALPNVAVFLEPPKKRLKR